MRPPAGRVSSSCSAWGRLSVRVRVQTLSGSLLTRKMLSGSAVSS